MPYEINKVGNMILKHTKQSVPVITKKGKKNTAQPRD